MEKGVREQALSERTERREEMWWESSRSVLCHSGLPWLKKHSHCSIVGWVVWGLFICSQVQMPFGVVGMLAWRKRLRQIHLKAVWLGFSSHTSPESFTIRLSHYASPKDDPANKSITFKSSIFGTFRITLRKIWQASVEMCCITIPKAPAQSNSFCSTYGSRTVWNTSLFFHRHRHPWAPYHPSHATCAQPPAHCQDGSGLHWALLPPEGLHLSAALISCSFLIYLLHLIEGLSETPCIISPSLWLPSTWWADTRQ